MRGAPIMLPGMSKCSAHVEPRSRTLVACDSGSVVMKVDTRSGMCNDPPAKATGSKNGWRFRALHCPSLLCRVDKWWWHAPCEPSYG